MAVSRSEIVGDPSKNSNPAISAFRIAPEPLVGRFGLSRHTLAGMQQPSENPEGRQKLSAH